MMDKQERKALKDFKLQLLKDYEAKKFLLNHETNWELLEELIKRANNNPGLKVTVKLTNGTILDLQTFDEKRQVNPIYSDIEY